MSPTVADLVRARGNVRGLAGLLARHELSGGRFVIEQARRNTAGRLFLSDGLRNDPAANVVDGGEGLG